MTEKNKGGRPLKFESPEELEAKIEQYFNSIEKDDIPTVAGLAVFLDVDWKTVNNYEGREEFFPTIKRAKTRILAEQEKLAIKGKLSAPVWIFSAKNNFGYTDKQEIDQNLKGEMNIVIDGAVKDWAK